MQSFTKSLVSSFTLINAVSASVPLPTFVERSFQTMLPAGTPFTTYAEHPFNRALGEWTLSFQRTSDMRIHYTLCCIRCPRQTVNVNLKWTFQNSIDTWQVPNRSDTDTATAQSPSSPFSYANNYNEGEGLSRFITHREEQYADNDEVVGESVEVAGARPPHQVHFLDCACAEKYHGTEDILVGMMMGQRPDPDRRAFTQTEKPVLTGVFTVELSQ